MPAEPLHFLCCELLFILGLRLVLPCPVPSTPLNQFLGRIDRRHPRLTHVEEIELGRRIREYQDWPAEAGPVPKAIERRGRKAEERFLLANVRLARYIAERYSRRGVVIDDLTQAALEGLLQAVRRFDPSRGFRFSSYAVWWAQQACQALVAQQGSGVRLPVAIREGLNAVRLADERLTRELGRTPTEAELEAAARLEPGRLKKLRVAACHADTRSLDALIGGDGDCTSWLGRLEGGIDPWAQLEEREQHGRLRWLVDTHPDLDAQQREILRCRYLSDKPITTVMLSAQLQICRDRCRKLETRALATLRAAL